VGPEQVGAEPVDEQDGDPAGAAQGLRQPQRVGGQLAALDRDAERRGRPGEDVGQVRRAVRGPDQVVRQHRPTHRRVARTCSPVATSR
jgi:hypothetical protein